MKETLIKYIEAYASAKSTQNEILISYSVQALNKLLDEIFKDDARNTNTQEK